MKCNRLVLIQSKIWDMMKIFSTLQAIYINPNFSGESLLSCPNYIFNHIKEASKEVGLVGKEGGGGSERLHAVLAKLAHGPISLDHSDIKLLRIRKVDGQSDVPDLAGLIFHTEYTGEAWQVSVVGGNIDRESKCDKWISFLALTSLGLITSPLTVPCAVLGMALKTSVYACSRRSLFCVRQIGLEDFPKMALMARSWQAIAHEKKHTREGEAGLESSIFDDCSTISKLIAQCFENPESCLKSLFEEAYVCQDNFGMEQGLMLTRNDLDQVKIVHLVTHPRNVRSSLNAGELEKVTGVGTMLVKYAANRCLELGKPYLYLEGTHSAKPFYERLGFEEIHGWLIEDGDYAMEVSAQKINELLNPRLKVA